MSNTTSQISVADVQKAHQDFLAAEQARNAGQLDHAQGLFEQLLDRHPDYFAALSTLGMVHMQRQANAAAFPYLAKAAMLIPKNWAVLTNLGKVYFELGAEESSLHFLNQSLKLAANQNSTLYFLGEVLHSQQQYDHAADCLERVCANESADSAAFLLLTQCYLYLGRYDDAVTALKKALESPINRDGKAFAYRLASVIPKEVEIDFDVLAAIDDLGAPQQDDEAVTALNLAFGRASCLDRLGQHREAWDCLVAINETLAGQYEEARQEYAKYMEMFVERSLNWEASADGSVANADNFPQSLHILGVSRSGKTTLESLIGTLPGVENLHENDLVAVTAQRVSQRAGLLTTDRLNELPSEYNSSISEAYKARLIQYADTAKITTITHLATISDVGRLIDCVPNVKFIFVKRNEDDNAFRIYQQLYRLDTNVTAYDLNDIYKDISDHNAMIDNWLEKLGNKAILVNYEEMVSDPKTTLAHLAEFCGLKPPSKFDLKIADDKDCSKPYLDWMQAAKSLQG